MDLVLFGSVWEEGGGWGSHGKKRAEQAVKGNRNGKASWWSSMLTPTPKGPSAYKCKTSTQHYSYEPKYIDTLHTLSLRLQELKCLGFWAQKPYYVGF